MRFAAAFEAVRIGTDFSGLGSFELAAGKVARVLGLEPVNMFASDVDKNCQRMILEHYRPHKFFPDISRRDHGAAPECDWYGAGFPCQPFSSAGLGLGINDQRNRGVLLADSLAYVKVKKPSLVVYENVRGLLHAKHAPLLAWRLQALQEAGYRTFVQVLNTADFRVPHHRERVYVVAIRSDRLRRAFTWPMPTACPALDTFLGALPGIDGPQGSLA